jgi:micrococcal nuclease
MLRIMGCALLVATLSAGAPTLAQEPHFATCGAARRITCVVDGDTIWLGGKKIRFEDIDAPETHEPRCASEKALGDRATERLAELLNAGGWTMRRDGDRDEDRYGRKLRTFHTAQTTIGQTLIAEGLAHVWDGRKHPWC